MDAEQMAGRGAGRVGPSEHGRAAVNRLPTQPPGPHQGPHQGPALPLPPVQTQSPAHPQAQPPGAPQPQSGERGLDRVDRSILRLLQQDGRASIRSVAERVHVSRANAYARIARMMEDGVIRGFTARVDHERAGQSACAYVTLKIVQNSWRTVREQLLELPGVAHIALVGGEFDVLMLVHTADNRALRELVLGSIQSIPEVLSTQTLLVFEETDRVPPG